VLTRGSQVAAAVPLRFRYRKPIFGAIIVLAILAWALIALDAGLNPAATAILVGIGFTVSLGVALLLLVQLGREKVDRQAWTPTTTTQGSAAWWSRRLARSRSSTGVRLLAVANLIGSAIFLFTSPLGAVVCALLGTGTAVWFRWAQVANTRNEAELRPKAQAVPVH